MRLLPLFLIGMGLTFLARALFGKKSVRGAAATTMSARERITTSVLGAICLFGAVGWLAH